ncbi:MAG: RNA-binding protein [Bacteroidales bacterium]|jgi:RNA recognition motif-containing protein|nr:RNA-binding protein [Bacteroidales bacterium]
MIIFVGRLSSKTCEKTLTDLFSDFGTIELCFVVRYKQTKHSRGYAYVIMPNNNEAKNAIQSMNNYELNGEKMMVKKARPGEMKFIKEEGSIDE